MQKQEILAYCHLAITLSNIINYKISHLKGRMYQYQNKYPRDKVKMFSPLSSPILILVFVYDNKLDNKEKGEGEGEGDKQNKIS